MSSQPSDSTHGASGTSALSGQPTSGETVEAQISAIERAREVLASQRQGIDNIDAALVHLLAERFRHTQEVGKLKARYGLPAADPDREARQVERLKRLADESGLDPVFAQKFMRFIVTEVIRHHEQIRERDGQ